MLIRAANVKINLVWSLVPEQPELFDCLFSQPWQNPAMSRCCCDTLNRAAPGSDPSSQHCSFHPAQLHSRIILEGVYPWEQPAAKTNANKPGVQWNTHLVADTKRNLRDFYVDERVVHCSSLFHFVNVIYRMLDRKAGSIVLVSLLVLRASKALLHISIHVSKHFFY